MEGLLLRNRPRRLRALAFAAALLVTPVAITSHALAQGSVPKEDPEGQLERLEEVRREGEGNTWIDHNGEDVRGRDEWFYFQRRYPYDLIPAGARATAVRQMLATERRLQDAVRVSKGEHSSLFAANKWSGVGPNNSGGRVRAIAINPRDPNVVLIGAAAGGIWKTVDGGANWYPTFDRESALTIGALAYDPNDSSIVFVGTGELRPAVDVTYLADGIFRSTDGGETWKNVGLNDVSAINKLHVHRGNSKIVYVAAGRNSSSMPRERMDPPSGRTGFFRSTDGGGTWQMTQSGTFYDMTVNPVDNDELWISSAGTVYHSTNGGETFTNSSTGINASSAIRMSISVSAVDPARLYALIARRGGSSNIGEVYISNNSGATWQLRATLPSSFFATQGDYNNCIAVDPENPDVVVAGGIELYRSEDAGANWANVSQWNAHGDPDRHHADQHIILFDPNIPNLLYVGNDGGVYQSFDGGFEWQRLHADLPITQFYTVDVSEIRPFMLLGGAQDNFTQGSFGTSGFSKEWRRLQGGDGFGVVIDMVNPDFIYQYGLTSSGSRLRRINTSGSGGPGDNRYIDGTISSENGYWVTPLAMSPISKKLYTGKRNLYVTDNPRIADGFPTWTKLTPGNADNMSALALSPHDEQKIIIGTVRGDIRFTTDGGKNWTVSKGSINRFVTDLAYDPVNPNRIYATYSGFGTKHILRSDDGGANFTSLQGNIPDMPVNTIEIDPNDNTHLFAGTDIGMFVSLDAGETWFPFNEGLPLTTVTDLKVQRSNRTLVAATFGRSMFSISLDNIQLQPLLIEPIGGETKQTPDTLQVRWAGLSGPVNIYISYEEGGPFHLVASDVTGSRDTINLPFAKTTTARIKVEETGGERRSVISGHFSLNPATNTNSLGERGFVAEAVEVRKSQIWATAKGTDSIYVLRVPFLDGRRGIRRDAEITGRIRDLAYDEAADIFYALVTNDDFTSPSIVKMDTTGAKLGTVTIPPGATAISGITMTPQGLALVTPGEGATIYVVDPTSGAVTTSTQFQNIHGEKRAGLVWNGLAYTQGVVEREPGLTFPSELQQITATDPARLYQVIPVVTSNSVPVYFVGLTLDRSSANPAEHYYYATDTAGIFYRFKANVLSGVEDGYVATGRQSAMIAAVTPNPMRGQADVHYTVATRETMALDLYTQAGERVARIFEGVREPGEYTATIQGAGLGSGIYYLALSTASGARSVKSVVIVK